MTVMLSLPSFPVIEAISQQGKRVDTAVIKGDKDSVVARCHRIIGYYEDEAHNTEHETARWLVEQLSQDEQEVAARCSYAYWFLSSLPQQQEHQQHRNRLILSLESARFATAMREAIRHLDCSDDQDEVLKLFRATIEFHTAHKTPLYRSCMIGCGGDIDANETIDDVLLSEERRDRIHDEMTNYQTNVVRGHDKEDRSIFFAFPRKLSGKADSNGEKSFVDSILYNVERALAASEFQSVGRQDQLFCVINTKGGSCPPFKNIQAAVGIMQRFYPGRLKHCVVLNAPYIVTGIFKMLKPFLDPITASKFVFPSSKAAPKGGGGKHHLKNDSSLISEMIDESQAMPVLMPGKGRLNPDVNVDRFLYEVPFYKLYDCCEIISDDGAEGPELLKLQSPTESNSTASLSLTDSSSIDSWKSYPKSARPSIFFNTSGGMTRFRGFARSKRQSRMPKTQAGKVSVRSLAIGELAVKNNNTPSQPLFSAEVVVANMKVHRRHPLMGRSTNITQ